MIDTQVHNQLAVKVDGDIVHVWNTVTKRYRSVRFDTIVTPGAIHDLSVAGATMHATAHVMWDVGSPRVSSALDIACEMLSRSDLGQGMSACGWRDYLMQRAEEEANCG